MESSTTVVWEIRPEENAEVAQVIRKVLIEIGVPKVGTAYADRALEHMWRFQKKCC